MARRQQIAPPDPLHLRSLKRAISRLHRWYRAAARDLPWRRTKDPYAIWISEVMLQQTQVATVIPYFERWIRAFPDVISLGRADPERVLELWEGLGYYSRARNLLAGAREMVERFDGRIPRTAADLGSIPGIGKYTTAAVLSIAFGHDLAVVDGNVRRVLARLIALPTDPRKAAATRLLESLATSLLPPGKAALHNQALMELGALICAPRSPRCETCPLSRPCLARAAGDPEAYPRRPRRKPLPHHHFAVGLVLDPSGALLIDRRPYEGFLGGLWELPKVRIEAEDPPGVALARRLAEGYGLRLRRRRSQALRPVDHAYSHFKVTLHPSIWVLLQPAPAAAEGGSFRWVDPDRLPPISRGDQKVLEQWKKRTDAR